MTGHGTGALLVTLGAAVGAPARWWVDRAVTAATAGRPGARDLPWGTLSVNLVGSLVLGVVAGLTVRLGTDVVALLVGTGFCGAFTTFSTFAVESVRLAEAGRWRAAAGNVLGSVALGLVVATLGYALGVRL